jgi:hypothetical protein
MTDRITSLTGTATVRVKTDFAGMGEDVGEATGSMMDRIASEFGRLGTDMVTKANTALSSTEKLFDQFGIELPKGIQSLVKKIGEYWNPIRNVLTVPPLTGLKQTLTDWKDFALEAIKIFKDLWGAIGKIVNKLRDVGFSWQSYAGGPQMGGIGGLPGSGVGVPGTGIGIPGGTTINIHLDAWVEEVQRSNEILTDIREHAFAIEEYMRAGSFGGVSASPSLGQMTLGDVDQGMGSLAERASRQSGSMLLAGAL